MAFFTSGKSEKRTTRTGQPYEWTYRPAVKNRPPQGVVVIDSNLPGHFALQREKTSHRLAKKLGFATEWQTGDGPFDEMVYILSDSPVMGSLLTGSASLRESLLWLFKFATLSIEQKKGRLTLVLNSAPPTLSSSEDEEVVHHLYRIKQGLGMLAAEQPNDAGAGMRRLAVLFKAGFVTLFTVGVLALLPGMFSGARTIDQWELWAVTAALTASIMGALLLAVLALFRHSSQGVDVLFYLMTLGLAGLTLGAREGLYEANTRLDKNPPSVTAHTVTDLYWSKRRKSSSYTYYAKLDGLWKNSTYHLRITESQYRALKRGDIIELTVHPGYLGVRWLETYKIRK